MYYSEDLSLRVEDWACRFCESYLPSKEQREHPLQHTEHFSQYCTLFESLMEEFMNDNSITLQQFHTAIRDDHEAATRQHGGNANATFASMLASSVDFRYVLIYTLLKGSYMLLYTLTHSYTLLYTLIHSCTLS
jgi:hypothetical protein